MSDLLTGSTEVPNLTLARHRARAGHVAAACAVVCVAGGLLYRTVVPTEWPPADDLVVPNAPVIRCEALRRDGFPRDGLGLLREHCERVADAAFRRGDEAAATLGSRPSEVDLRHACEALTRGALGSPGATRAARIVRAREVCCPPPGARPRDYGECGWLDEP